jgi:hypothetical protein
VAVTDRAAVIETTHVPVPEQPDPLQPVNTEPALAEADSVTDVPELNVGAHVDPQLTPVGELVTVPLPEPDFDTVSA